MSDSLTYALDPALNTGHLSPTSWKAEQRAKANGLEKQVWRAWSRMGCVCGCKGVDKREKLQEEAVSELTLQHAEVGIQGFHLTSNNGAQLVRKGMRGKGRLAP